MEIMKLIFYTKYYVFFFMQLICFMLHIFALAKFILETKEIIIIMFDVVKKYLINVIHFFSNIYIYILVILIMFNKINYYVCFYTIVLIYKMYKYINI